MPFRFSTPPFATEAVGRALRPYMTRTKRARRLALLRLSYRALAHSRRFPSATLLGHERGAQRVRTNTSVVPLVSPRTKVVASEVKATKRPSAEIATPRS